MFLVIFGCSTLLNTKRMLEGGYIQTGEQFVQLRCMREKLQAMQ